MHLGEPESLGIVFVTSPPSTSMSTQQLHSMRSELFMLFGFTSLKRRGYLAHIIVLTFKHLTLKEIILYLSLKMCDDSYSYHLHSFYVLVQYICVLKQFLCLIPDSVVVVIVVGKVCVLWAKSVHSFFSFFWYISIKWSHQNNPVGGSFCKFSVSLWFFNGTSTCIIYTMFHCFQGKFPSHLIPTFIITTSTTQLCGL